MMAIWEMNALRNAIVIGKKKNRIAGQTARNACMDDQISMIGESDPHD